MTEIKWQWFDNEKGNSVDKQHAFKPIDSKTKYIEEQYTGNKALCGRFRITEDGENSISFDEIEAHKLNREGACKNCLKIFTYGVESGKFDINKD